MNWDYVAGFFDGEGHVGKPRQGSLQLTFCNTNRPALEDIQQFIGRGTIYLVARPNPARHLKNASYQLRIFKHSDVLTVAQELVTRCIIKRSQLATAIDYIRNKPWLNPIEPGRNEKGQFKGTVWLGQLNPRGEHGEFISPKGAAREMGVEVKTG